MKILNNIAKLKVYFGGASLYLSIINFILLLATFKLTYHIDVSAYFIVPIGLAFTLLLGWLDYKFILKPQQIYTNKTNDIKEQLDRIEEKINRS